MSVYGGDSWAREAQHRKRRVDELMLDGIHGDSSSFKKLSNGKFSCLLCSHHPLLDSSLILSMHSKGARHRAALTRLKEKELMKEKEIHKRVALSSDHTTTYITHSNPALVSRVMNKPLIEQTRKAASEVLEAESATPCNIHEKYDLKFCANTVSVHHGEGLKFESNTELVAVPRQVNFRELREKELKFTAAGWKRDCHGKWYRDENVEFDSDEEDPNTCLA